MPINFNSEVIVGITLITIGVLTFAKGSSNKIAIENYLKSAQTVSNLVNTAETAINISKSIPQNEDEE